MPTLKVTWRQRTAAKMRFLFSLHVGNLRIPGQIFERPDPRPHQDRWFWSFAGKFPWDVGDTLPPFSYVHDGTELGPMLYFGIPQVMLKALCNFETEAVDGYQKTPEHRNCGNCAFLRFLGEQYSAYRDRPTHERFVDAPTHFYACAASGSLVDHYAGETPRHASTLLKHLRSSLLENSCSSHTRAAYQIEVSPDVRTVGGETTRWVPSELRRLRALNPESYSLEALDGTGRWRAQLPYDVRVEIAPERD